MDIGAIDRSATAGTSWLHVASPNAKLIAFALVLAAVVVSWNPFVILGVGLLLLAAVVSARVDLRLALALAAYPGVFALIFALASAPDPLTGATIVLKAVTAALAAVTVVLTTSYPHVFAPVQRITPSIVGDALLMTYRTLFLLLEKSSNLLRAVRLRSGLRRGNPVRSARAVVASLGGLMLYSFDLAQRDYDIMRLRGYQGRLRVGAPRVEAAWPGVVAVVLAATALAVSLAWRIQSETLNPYSWLAPVLPALGLAVTFVAVRRTR